MNPHRDRVNDALQREVVRAAWANARRVEGSDIDWLNIPDSAKPNRRRRQGGFLPYLYRRRGYIAAMTPDYFMGLLPEYEGHICRDVYSAEISKRWHNHEFWTPFKLLMVPTKNHWRVSSASEFDYQSARFLLRRKVGWVRVQIIPEDDSQSTNEIKDHLSTHGLIPLGGEKPHGPIEHISITL